MKRIILVAAGLSLGLLLPQDATASEWELIQSVCGGSTLTTVGTCVDFHLQDDGNGTYWFRTTFVGSYYGLGYSEGNFPGVITRIGIYDLDGDPRYKLTDVKFVAAESYLAESVLKGVHPDSLEWTVNHAGAKGKGEDKVQCPEGDGSDALFEACANSDPARVKNGMRVGDFITFSFRLDPESTNPHITTASFTNSEEAGLGARVHIQEFGDDKCSVKLDSRRALERDDNDGFFSGENCRPPGVSVPEPMTMLLLGSGLFGIGGVAMRRRRQELDLESEDAQI